MKSERWQKIKKDGKTHYAITRGMFGIGIPLALGMLALTIYSSGNIYAVIGTLGIAIPGAMFVGYSQGRKNWDLMEKLFSEPVCPMQDRPREILPPTKANSLRMVKTAVLTLLIAGVAIFSLLLFASSFAPNNHSHVVIDSDGKKSPAPGYKWLNPSDIKDFRVVPE